ncbi:MAG TPA: O-antigen ligase family protein [Capillimicrobium sp.]|nr:O-antigen ligase family protein [Capillimicrobium sp.]
MTRIVRRDLPALLPATALVGVLLWWALDGGGYATTTWLPGTLALLGLLVVVLAAAPRRRPAPGAVLALGAIAAYTAWSYLSVTWADNQGVALEGSHRTLLFAACFALGVAIPWTVTAARAALVLAALALTAVALVTTVRLGAPSAPDLFIDARLASPVGYQNADAALWTVGAALALLLAGRREVWAPVRPVLLAGGGVQLALAVLAQSRGWVFALPVIALVLVAATPNRVRLALFALPVAAAVALALEPLLEPFRVAGGVTPGTADAELAVAAADARSAILLVGAGLLAAGAAAVAIDARVTPSARVRQASGRVAAALAAVALVAGAAIAFAATDGAPGQRVADAWADFRDFEQPDGGASRFESLGSTRYDFWRVGWELAGDHLLAGIGQDNFAQPYLERREAGEEPRWTHSLELRLLVHTGLVGALLFAAFLAGVAWAAWRRLRAAPPVAAVAAAGLAPLVVWLVHGSVDWLWEVPVLSAAALAFAGMVAALPAHDAGEPGALAVPRRWPRAARVATAAAGAALGLVAALAVTAAWVADHDVEVAARDWPADPDAALRRLDRAADLDPLDAEPLVVEGTIEMYRDRPERARAAFAEAVERTPRDWLPRFQLGLAASATRDVAGARAAFEAARARSPRDPLIALALRRLDSDRRLSYRTAVAYLQARVERRLGG